MGLSVTLLSEFLDALERDGELRARAERLLTPMLVRGLEQALGAEYLDRRGVVAFGLEWATVRRAATRGEVRLLHIGRRTVVRRADLLEWAGRQGVPASAPRIQEVEEQDPFRAAVARAEARRRRAG